MPMASRRPNLPHDPPVPAPSAGCPSGETLSTQALQAPPPRLSVNARYRSRPRRTLSPVLAELIAVGLGLLARRRVEGGALLSCAELPAAVEGQPTCRTEAP